MTIQEFAKYLDWYETAGAYQDPPDGKDRRKLKEIRLLVRRFGLDDAVVTPPPDHFMTIQAKGSMTWTDTHQWLILLRFFDVLCHLRGIDDPDFDRVAASTARLLPLTGSLGQVSFAFRL